MIPPHLPSADQILMGDSPTDPHLTPSQNNSPFHQAQFSIEGNFNFSQDLICSTANGPRDDIFRKRENEATTSGEAFGLNSTNHLSRQDPDDVYQKEPGHSFENTPAFGIQSLISRSDGQDEGSSSDGRTEIEGRARKRFRFQEMDSSNYLRDKNMNTLQPDDVQSLMNSFSRFKLKDSSFFYTVQVDAGNHSTNFFWTDGLSRIDYDCFGDVLVLDTSFRLVYHDMICALFWGVNHHQQPILFGCGFLLDKYEDSFIWLFKNFMVAMGNHKPKTFYTDESQEVASAIEKVFPETEHRLGLSYIRKNAKERYLSEYFDQQPGFGTDFEDCIFHCQSEKEFDSQWSSLLANYKLGENSWLCNLHKSRKKWSNFGSKKALSADIESMLTTFGIFRNLAVETTTLSNLFKHYVKAAAEMRLEELNKDDKMVAVKSEKEILNHAKEIFTSTMFRKFQEQWDNSISLAMEKVATFGNISTFKLTKKGHKEEFTVTFDCSSSTVTCSCENFESVGMLCGHCIKVLDENNIFQIPSQYILKRWTKSAEEEYLVHKALYVITQNLGHEETRKIVEAHLDMAAKSMEQTNATSPEVNYEAHRGIGISDAVNVENQQIASHSSCCDQSGGFSLPMQYKQDNSVEHEGQAESQLNNTYSRL